MAIGIKRHERGAEIHACGHLRDGECGLLPGRVRGLDGCHIGDGEGYLAGAGLARAPWLDRLTGPEVEHGAIAQRQHSEGRLLLDDGEPELVGVELGAGGWAVDVKQDEAEVLAARDAGADSVSLSASAP
jgi:hypothetical protein